MPETGSAQMKRRKILHGVRSAVRRRAYLFSIHAARRMTERHISVGEVEETLLRETEVVEDYPDDARGPSCLILGSTEAGRILHVQCTYPPNVAVITVYEPAPKEWDGGRVRKANHEEMSGLRWNAS